MARSCWGDVAQKEKKNFKTRVHNTICTARVQVFVTGFLLRIAPR